MSQAQKFAEQRANQSNVNTDIMSQKNKHCLYYIRGHTICTIRKQRIKAQLEKQECSSVEGVC